MFCRSSSQVHWCVVSTVNLWRQHFDMNQALSPHVNILKLIKSCHIGAITGTLEAIELYDSATLFLKRYLCSALIIIIIGQTLWVLGKPCWGFVCCSVCVFLLHVFVLMSDVCLCTCWCSLVCLMWVSVFYFCLLIIMFLSILCNFSVIYCYIYIHIYIYIYT